MSIQPVTENTLALAASILQSGGLVAFPTETVYGLGADAANDQAVATIFAAKGRPVFNPLIVHVSSVAMARQEVEWNARAEKLAAAFWPGPLTLVLPRKVSSRVSLLVSAGGNTVGVRLPAHPVARALIEKTGVPVAAPSANRSGRVSPTTAQHVEEELGEQLPLIVDGGACPVGVESTVVDVSGPQAILLRPGGVTHAMLEDVLQEPVSQAGQQGGALKSPGLLESHYAPSLPVRLHAISVEEGEALLAFGPQVPAGARRVINLSEAGDDKEAAAHLFAALRALDSAEYTAIAVMPIPEAGLGAAINDRLRRAAAERCA